LYLSGLNAASILKGKLNTSFGELIARKGLVIFQFALSVIFIVSVIVVYKQIEFLQSTNLGYQKDNIIYFEREGKLDDLKNLETLLSEIKNTPDIISASSIAHDMTGHNSGTTGVRWEGRDPEDRTEFENVTVNYGMIEALGLTMATGRPFSSAFGSDTAKIIFNETAIKFMNMKDPLGKVVTLWGKDMQIIGIVKDFHYESLHENIKPVFLRLSPDDTHIIMVKLSGTNQPETIAKLKSVYEKINPDFTFDYQYLDIDYQQQYVAEQRVATLSKYFAGLAILISCLGLFGLAAFTAERRTKEIGIRKALGASAFGIVYLLSSDFTKIIITSIIIALPTSFLLTRVWLSDFAFKINLEWWHFIGSGFLVLGIAWLTISTQAFRASRINPADCLKEQ
jgi:ABC-type antimicrobial peptide transport system permease subunit